MFEQLKAHYTVAEATAVINDMLANYGDTVRITFRETDAEIVDSYLVDDVSVRHTVCEIIARTGVTKRSYEDLSAEWRVHNVSFDAGVMTDHAKDVSLDYDRDPRRPVRLATKVFDLLDME